MIIMVDGKLSCRPCLLYLLIVMQCLNSGEHRVGAGGLLPQSPPPTAAADNDDDELHTEHRIDITSAQTSSPSSSTPSTATTKELSYRQQIARQQRIQYAEVIYRHKYYTVTLKSR